MRNAGVRGATRKRNRILADGHGVEMSTTTGWPFINFLVLPCKHLTLTLYSHF